MKRDRCGLAFALAFALGGCTQAHWSKSGAASQQVEADTAACRQAAGQDGFITVYQNQYAQIDAEQHFRECMKERGYAEQIR